MIKRPLVWILSSYLVGMYLAWRGLPIMIPIIIALLFALLACLMMYRFENPYISRKDRFLFSLPLLLILGFCSLRDQQELPKLSGAFDQKINCELSGQIHMIVTKSWGKVLYVKNNLVTLPEGDRYLCENIIVSCFTNSDSYSTYDSSLSKEYLVGNQITVRGTLQKFSEPRNPGQFNERLYYQIENIDFKMKAYHILVTDASYSRLHAFLDKIKLRLLRAYESMLPTKEAGTVIAMLLGEKYLLDDEIKQLYQENGISHVLAISGLHISLIGMFIYWLLKKLKVPGIIATGASIFMIYCYGVLTNFSVSTNRAVVMMTVLLLSGVIGKTYDMLSSLSLSALIILLQNPLQILSVGFLLSFGAVLGIATLYPCLQKLLPTKNKILSSLYLSIGAQLATTPFILYFYYQFPTYSVLTNLIILPFVSVLTLLSIFAGIVGAICLPLGIFLIGGANYILQFYEWICRVTSMLPKHLITLGRPRLLILIFYLLLMSIFIWCAHRFQKKAVLLLPILATLLLLLPERREGLSITILDVGQGDGIFMESSSGTTYLIDGGSSDVYQVGISRIQPYLLWRGRDCLDYAIVTHSDSDHISGLMEMMQSGKIKIKNLILPEIGNKDEAYQRLESLAISKKIKLQYISTGDYIVDGKLTILCLHPTRQYTAPSANDYSTVLSVSYGEFDLLLTGDLPQEGEEEIMELWKDSELWEKYFGKEDVKLSRITDYDVLKVAHHGSKYSSGEDFLELMKPEISMISCGKDNRYGHPHSEVVNRLIDINNLIYTTYDAGAIKIKTDGEIYSIEKYKRPHKSCDRS